MTFALFTFSWAKAPSFLMALAGIGLLIFLHELGHFLFAKRMGMPVETFSIGFGPRLLGFRWKETDVRLSALPLGGYVKLAGFNPEEPGAEDPHGFLKQPYRKRMLFYAGGIIANTLVAWLCFSILRADDARVLEVKPSTAPLKVEVVQGMPAERAGARTGDELLAVGDFAPTRATWEQTVAFIQARPGQALPIKVRRVGQELTFPVTLDTREGKGVLGLKPTPEKAIVVRRALTVKDVGVGMVRGAEDMGRLAGQVFAFLKRLFTFQASRAEVAGPAGIVGQMTEAATIGWELFLSLLGAISLQLAILNALPVPMLDGGHMLLLTIEKLRRRDLSMELKERLLQGGFILLMSLMAVVIFFDVMKLRK
jgi:regulator of sigma E protease